MATNEFRDLVTGAGQAADTARFRVGSCKVSVIVGGKPFDASDVTVVYGDNGLPLCTLLLPIGTAVGVKASGQKNTVADMQATFSKFTPVEVKVEIIDLSATVDIGNAMKAGTFTIFTGIVSSTRLTSTGRTEVALMVRVVHKLVALGGGVALFSNLVSAYGFGDYSQVMTGYFGEVRATATNQPWHNFKLVAEIFRNSSIDIRQQRWPDDDENLARIKLSSQRSLTLLNEVLDVAELKFTGPSASNTRDRIQRQMSEILTATQTNMNLLISTIRAANGLFCKVIFTRTKGYFIPMDPLWHSRDIKILRAGSSFQQEHDRAAGTGYDGMREGYDITGTIVTAALPSSYFSSSKEVFPGIFGSYVMPQGLGSEYALVDHAELPSWLDITTLREVTCIMLDGAGLIEELEKIYSSIEGISNVEVKEVGLI